MMIVLLMSMIVNAYNVNDDNLWHCGGPRGNLCYVPQRKHHVFKYIAPQPETQKFRYQQEDDNLSCLQGCVLIAQAQYEVGP